jgi:hypothetical protein
MARFKKATNGASFALAVGATASVFPPLFTSAPQNSSAVFAEVTSVTLGTITFSSAGPRYFKFYTLANPPSGGYWMFIDAIYLDKAQ